MLIEITDEMQGAFLEAKAAADREGHGGTSYVQGLRAVLAIVERDMDPQDRLGEAMRRVDFLNRSTGDGAYAIQVAAREYGVDL
jgi:hypothetical protein